MSFILAVNDGFPGRTADVIDPATTSGYGGIWLTGQPFQLNAKCIVFGLILACIYMMPRFAGTANWFMLAFLFCMSYISMSIYDAKYHCNARLLSSEHSVTGIFKPQNVDQKPPPGKVLARDQEKAYRRAVYYTHFTVLAPLIMLTSLIAMRRSKELYDVRGTKPSARDYTILPITFGLGLLALFYHGARLIWPRDSCVGESHDSSL